jgi:hypothetical protein
VKKAALRLLFSFEGQRACLRVGHDAQPLPGHAKVSYEFDQPTYFS